ncbi:MAG TPA: hypothetical protein VFM21_05620, partial [Terriglobia bacterium]|nr:hypothetical protein [Terriglobia bacterium]
MRASSLPISLTTPLPTLPHKGGGNKGNACRRDFITALAAGATAWPFAARAEEWEPGRVYRLAFLIPTPRNQPVVAAFFDELRNNGLVEGQNLLIVSGSFGVQNDQVPAVAASLVASSPDAIVAGPELPIRAL